MSARRTAGPQHGPRSTLRAVKRRTAKWRGEQQLQLYRREWPVGVPLNPDEIDIVRGWHSADESGPWDVDAMLQEMGGALVHSELWKVDRDSSRGIWRSLVFAPTNNLFVAVAQQLLNHITLRVWAKSPKAAAAEFHRLRGAYLRERQSGMEDKAEFFIVTVRQGEPQARLVTTTPKVRTGELKLHYGDDFLDWHVGFIARLKTTTSGLTVFQGLPGTGKTSYIRHLIGELRQSHRTYVVATSSFELLTSPACVDFWLGENEQRPELHKLVVVEDAESLIAARGLDNAEPLSSLLNAADGLLADYLKVHLICTVNTRIDKLDPAIVRPGRLIASREFRRLTPPEAQRIAAARGLALRQQDDYSLAEIYNHHSSQTPALTGQRIGFGPES